MSTPRLPASSRASDCVPSDDHCDGITTHVTLSGPSASAATSATSVESIPPERPITTCLKPFFST